MESKLEITTMLEEQNGLDESIFILNLPAAKLCTHGCRGCITGNLEANLDENLPINDIKGIIDYFHQNYKTRFITVNGRGDPFHPRLKEETLEKIEYATSKNIQSYIFTAGDNLDSRVCDILAENKSNVMISLFGNQFIDSKFFEGQEYTGKEKTIAENIRRLIERYNSDTLNPKKGVTRIGMNYVISERDLEDEQKIKDLKEKANQNNIFFICNTNFHFNYSKDTQNRMRELANKYSDFHLEHSTAVNGQCRMGSGSSATVDYNGALYKCPYMNGIGDGNFMKLSEEDRKKVLGNYLKNNEYACVLRKV